MLVEAFISPVPWSVVQNALFLFLFFFMSEGGEETQLSAAWRDLEKKLSRFVSGSRARRIGNHTFK